MDSYHRLTPADRETVSRMEAQGCSARMIARALGRQPSTITRELVLGTTPWGYRALTAAARTRKRQRQRRGGRRYLASRPGLFAYVLAKLRLRWSPAQIVQTLKLEYPWDDTMRVSHETIYTYLYCLPRGTLKKELIACLRQGRKRRRGKRKETRPVAPKIKDMVSIEDRPVAVSDRTLPGHWEGDIILGKCRQSFLGTLVERTTRTTILVPLKNKTAPEVRAAFERELKTLPRQFKQTLTYDQGTEMAEHKLFAKHTRMKVYFAHPASPWERGTNENTNGLIRQFFPKGHDFTTTSRREVKRVQRLLNGRPRKVLDWKKPDEVFRDLLR